MDFEILSFVGAGNDAPASSSPSTGSLFSFSSPELWRRSDSDPVRTFRLEPEFKPKPAFAFQRSAHDAAASFSISFNSPPALDFYKQGYGCGGSTDGMHSPFTRCRDPFTPSQWLDLQLQALIYKYIVTNKPVPYSLLFQIRKSLNPFLFVGSSSGSYAPNTFGWDPFHLGLSGSNDPEPGRCRRTDGKKWRCSKEAVPDQKYCERHLNRGRHRSRKPVEDRKGQVVAGTINTREMLTDSSPSDRYCPATAHQKAWVCCNSNARLWSPLLQILPLMLLLTEFKNGKECPYNLPPWT